MIKPMLSGHCATPSDGEGGSSHDRCARNGGGNKARPSKEFQPCPCPCHFLVDGEPPEQYECGGCGGVLVEAPHWPNEDTNDVDDNGDPGMVYTHIDPRTGFALGEECS